LTKHVYFCQEEKPKKIMIEDNTTDRWKSGDIVIHDSDSKEHKMLMVVLSVDDTGMAKTLYFNIREIVPKCIIRKFDSFEKIPFKVLKQYLQVWENDLQYLHDPARFGIKITDQDSENASNLMLNKFYYNR